MLTSENLRQAALVIVPSGAWLLVLLIPDGYKKGIPTFPIKDRSVAISIARKVCHDTDPPLKWQAHLNPINGIWVVDTMPSICSNKIKKTKHLWDVEVPANGAYPTKCQESLYEIICDPN